MGGVTALEKGAFGSLERRGLTNHVSTIDILGGGEEQTDKLSFDQKRLRAQNAAGAPTMLRYWVSWDSNATKQWPRECSHEGNHEVVAMGRKQQGSRHGDATTRRIVTSR